MAQSVPTMIHISSTIALLAGSGSVEQLMLHINCRSRKCCASIRQVISHKQAHESGFALFSLCLAVLGLWQADVGRGCVWKVCSPQHSTGRHVQNLNRGRMMQVFITEKNNESKKDRKRKCTSIRGNPSRPPFVPLFFSVMKEFRLHLQLSNARGALINTCAISKSRVWHLLVTGRQRGLRLANGTQRRANVACVLHMAH